MSGSSFEVIQISSFIPSQEPHPADDLNGFDVARKLTILSRTITLSPATKSTPLPSLQSFQSVQTASLIPQALEGIASGDEFVARLPEFDATFDEKRKKASQNGKVLRFVGVVDAEKGEVKAALEELVIGCLYRTFILTSFI
jgi:homoserine dehydrogenase